MECVCVYHINDWTCYSHWVLQQDWCSVTLLVQSVGPATRLVQHYNVETDSGSCNKTGAALHC